VLAGKPFCSVDDHRYRLVRVTVSAFHGAFEVVGHETITVRSLDGPLTPHPFLALRRM
jgi:hypothetical protein